MKLFQIFFNNSILEFDNWVLKMQSIYFAFFLFSLQLISNEISQYLGNSDLVQPFLRQGQQAWMMDKKGAQKKISKWKIIMSTLLNKQQVEYKDINGMLLKEFDKYSQIYIFIFNQLFKYLKIMDDDFFGADSTPQTNPPPVATTYDNLNNQADDQFNFGDAQYEANAGLYQSGQDLSPSRANGSYSNFEGYDNVSASKAIEEEQRIQQMLHQKSQKQYSLKKQRREQGQKQLEEFLLKKQKETVNRKNQNREKEKAKQTQQSKVQNKEGWNKVVSSVPIKQGEHKGSKDINRMRQALINKAQDQK